VGKGIAIEPEDLVLRTTWFKTDESGLIASLAAPTLVKPIEGFTPLGGYKGILIYKNMGARLSRVQTFAPHKAFRQPVENCVPIGLPPIAQPFADENIFLVPWGESAAVSLPKVKVPSSVVCGIDLVRGIGYLMGFETIQDAAFTGETDTNLAKKAEAALFHARQGKFVLLHINGADEAATGAACVKKIDSSKRQPQNARGYCSKAM
jgi:2,3-bisphosphoglycerate-independent phosphoglycerate mutase